MSVAHSKLGASSASRWMNCPGSVKMIDNLPFKVESSKFAEAGTIAHKLAELCLLDLFQPCPTTFIGEDIVNEDTGEVTVVDEDTALAVKVYTDYVYSRVEQGGQLQVEVKFDLSHVIEQGMFGTSDAVLYFPEKNELEILDYKHGTGYVSPEKNSQLKFYALGAMHALKVPSNTKIKLTIAQPRAKGESIKTWMTTVDDLNEYAKELKIAADVTRDPNAKLCAGDWCFFCPARKAVEGSALPFCPEKRKDVQNQLQLAFGEPVTKAVLPDAKDMLPEKLVEVMKFAPDLKTWLKSVEEEAFRQAERGVSIPGYKLVKRLGNRVWKDEANSAQKLLEVFGDQVLQKPRLKSPAQLEALKISKQLVATMTDRPEKGLTLVENDDKRDAVAPPLAIDTVFGKIV